MLGPSVCSISLGPPRDLTGQVSFSPFSKWGTQAPESFSKFPKVIQLASDKDGTTVEAL